MRKDKILELVDSYIEQIEEDRADGRLTDDMAMMMILQFKSFKQNVIDAEKESI